MSDDRGLVAGRRILTVLLVLSAAVHVRLAFGATGPVLAGLDGLVAAAAVVSLLACAVAGGLGVALFLVPGLLAVAQGTNWTAWLDAWSFGGLLLDAMVVRIAVFTLRRAEGVQRR